MANKILDLPIAIFGVLFIGGFIALSLGLVLFVRPFVANRYSDGHNAALDTGFTAVGTLYAIVAGLLVFGVYSTFEQADQASVDEASNLILMHQQAAAFPQPYRQQAQEAIVSYTRSVVDDDWRALADGKGSPETTQALNDLYAVLAPIEPGTAWSDQYSKSVEQLGQVLKLRNQRIDSSHASLESIYWVLLYVGAFLTIVHLSLLRMENRTMHLIAVAVTSAMLGMVLFLLIEVNQPFRGGVVLSPDSFQSALALMATGRS